MLVTLRAPKPPTREETRADPPTTLAWIKERCAQIYSIERIAEGIALSFDLVTYMSTYTAIHAYGTTAESIDREPGFAVGSRDIYRCLEQSIRACCTQSYELLSQSSRDIGDKFDAQELLTSYHWHWTAFADTTKQAEHLFCWIERHYIKRELDENRKDIYLIRQLHFKIWAEEVLGVETASGRPVPGKPSDILCAMLKLKQEPLSELGEALKNAVSSLSILGLTLLHGKVVEVQS